MKRPEKQNILSKVIGKPAAIAGIFVLSLIMLHHSASARHRNNKRTADTSVSAYIKSYLQGERGSLVLYFPQSVERFYSANNNQPVWTKGQTDAKKTWEAMLLLDCVLQYGLNHADYHPNDLPYDKWHLILEKPSEIDNRTKARFDLLLTDALITLMNHLHYGKLNPYYQPGQIDEGLNLPFYADSALINARQQPDLMSAILAAQPQCAQYKNLQYHMRLLEGLYTGDCYQVPDSLVRKIAINMERLRWAEIDTKTYVEVNIPAYTLTFFQPDTSATFRVVVGKTNMPTPALNSSITYMTTTPEWVIPHSIFVSEILPKALKDTAFMDDNHYGIYSAEGAYVPATKANLLTVKGNPANYVAHQSAGCDNALGTVVFRFANQYDIYLHDTPEQQLFKKNRRAFSHSCVRVERASQFAELLLKQGGSAEMIPQLDKFLKAGVTRNISLKQPVPLKIVYLTCTVDNGKVTQYADVYGLDRQLEMALYNATEEQLSMK